MRPQVVFDFSPDGRTMAFSLKEGDDVPRGMEVIADLRLAVR